MHAVAARLAAHLAPRTARLPRDLARRQADARHSGREDEPVYGKVYLPRKFKIGVWRCPKTTASTSSARTSACSPTSRAATSSASTCSPAAAWA